VSASRPNQPRVGYLTVLPAALKKNRLHFNETIEQLRRDAHRRVESFGLELVGTTRVVVLDCTTVTVDDPAYRDEFDWEGSLCVFVEVHVRNPITGTETNGLPNTFQIPPPPDTIGQD
jgi:hypothetical protein